MNLIFFDDSGIRSNMLPFTFTRPLADIRIGILTIREKWENIFSVKSSDLTVDYLSEKFPCVAGDDNILINGALIPDTKILEEIRNLKPGTSLSSGKTFLASRVDSIFFKNKISIEDIPFPQPIEYASDPVMIRHSWDIFSLNGKAISNDFKLITAGRKSISLSTTNQIIGDKELLFLEEGAKVECSVINTIGGCVYIGKHAEIMEGSLIRGPFSLGEHSAVKMGAKIYGPTTIGPYSKVGGEINNSVIFGYSNKAHDGFLGNAVIGEWCNLGADTNNSNLKNNYSSVKMWNYATESFVDTGLQFCGLMMGDHSKSAINTMFNTGTVVGVSANIFGFGFPSKLVPSFSWDGADELATFSFEQACDVASKVMERRGKLFSETEKRILQHVFSLTSKHRHWEKV